MVRRGVFFSTARSLGKDWHPSGRRRKKPDGRSEVVKRGAWAHAREHDRSLE